MPRAAPARRWTADRAPHGTAGRRLATCPPQDGARLHHHQSAAPRWCRLRRRGRPACGPRYYVRPRHPDSAGPDPAGRVAPGPVAPDLAGLVAPDPADLVAPAGPVDPGPAGPVAPAP